MKIEFPFILGLRFLGIGSKGTTSNARKSLFGAMVGIGISIVPLIVVLVVANGMIEGISARIIELSSSHIRALNYSRSDKNSNSAEFYESLSLQIQDDENLSIAGAWSERQGNAIVVGSSGRSGGTVRAIEPRYFSENKSVVDLLQIKSGTTILNSPNEALLGDKMAHELGLLVGDSFRIITLRSTASGTTIPRFTTVTLVGIVSAGYQEIDSLWVFIPFETGMKILSEDSSSTFINIQTHSLETHLEATRHAVIRTLPDGFTAYTWKELNRSQFQSFTTTRTLLLFIMFLILLVASINVSSALVMLVLERRREIAILKSCGSDSSSITFAFLFAGFLTGAGGTIVGVPLGILCAIHINTLFSIIEKSINGINSFFYILFSFDKVENTPVKIVLLDPAYYLEKIPVSFSLSSLFLIVVGTLLLSVIVSALPAIRAGSEKPLDTLRKL